MKTYKIRIREVSIGEYYEEAHNPEAAIRNFNNRVLDGEIDFSDMEVIESQVIGIELVEEEK